MATGQTHLARRGSIYYWQARLPKGLGEALRRKHLVWSLRTHHFALARKRARRFSVAIDNYENWLMSTPTKSHPTKLQLRLVLENIFDKILADGEAVREAEPEGQYRYAAQPQKQNSKSGPTTAQDRATAWAEIDDWTEDECLTFIEESELAASMPDIVAAEWQGNVQWNNIEQTESFVKPALRNVGVSFDKADPQYAAFLKDANKVIAQAFAIEFERWKGEYKSEQRLPSFVEHKYGGTYNGKASTSLSNTDAKFLSLTIEELANDFVKQRELKSAHGKTAKDDLVSLKYFIALIGNLQIGQIKKSHAEQYADLLLRVPNLFNKSIYKGLSINEAIATADKLEAAIKKHPSDKQTFRFKRREITVDEAKRSVERLTKKTANKHLTFFTSLWKSKLVPDKFRKECPFSGCLFKKADIRKEGRSRGTRVGFSDNDLIELFSTPVWAGCASVKVRSVSGNHIIGDWRYWGPILALYTGMRLEEISSLHAGDFNTANGVWFINIDGSAKRNIKSEAAKRHIPIHSRLIELGFQDFVNQSGTSGPIFKELKPTRSDERYGDRLGKWFGYYRRQCGVYQRHKDFHSLRHNFVERLLLRNVPEDQVAVLVGHELNNITRSVYGTTGSIEQKKANIERLEYNLPLLPPSLF